MSDVLIKLRAFYENAETDESLYDIRRAIEELERLYALPLFDGPPTWQEEVAAVEDAFDRSGVKPTWPDDEPGNIGPMAAAMEAEIARLRDELASATRHMELAEAAWLRETAGNSPVAVTLTPDERSAIADAADRYASITPESAQTVAALRGLLDRTK